jgi:hypothetical protein
LGVAATPKERDTAADVELRERDEGVVVPAGREDEDDRDGGLYAFAVAQIEQRRRVMDALSVTLRPPLPDAQSPQAQPPNREDVVRLSADGRAAADDAIVASLYPTSAGARSRAGSALQGLDDSEASAIEEDAVAQGAAIDAANGEEQEGDIDAAPLDNVRPSDGSDAQGANAPTGDGEANLEPSPTAGEPELTKEEQHAVEALAERDREVRAHEQAHKAVAGRYAGAVSLSYTTGPNGRRYANSGEVPVDLSRVSGDALATVQKLEQVKRAALAPADPSSADRRVAARAAQGAREARVAVLEEAVGKTSAPEQPARGPEIEPRPATRVIETARPATVDGRDDEAATGIKPEERAPTAPRAETPSPPRKVETAPPSEAKSRPQSEAETAPLREAEAAPPIEAKTTPSSGYETAASATLGAQRAAEIPQDPPSPSPDLQPPAKLSLSVYA